MARINIEDSLFKEKAFEKLVIKLGGRRQALGALVELWMVAQKFYLTTVNDRMIPLNEWTREELCDELIECGFAEHRDNGIYVRGSEKQFSWLVQRSDAGKSSARIKAEKKSTTVNDRPTTVNGSQPLTLTPTLTLTQNAVVDQKSIFNYDEKNNSNWFSDFVIKEMQTLDTGLINYTAKINKAFVNEFGFREWFSGVAKTKKFAAASPDEQVRYFKAALSSELKSRGFL